MRCVRHRVAMRMRVLNMLQAPLVAIDVGTATTRVHFAAGDVAEGPSVVREEVRGTVVTRAAMRAGVVADTAAVAEVVHRLLQPRRRRWQRRPGAVVCAPTDVSTEEREALIEAVAAAGASVMTVVPEPLAAAIGAGVDVASEYATAIVDIGDGVTDFAVFRNATMIRSRAQRVGCGTLRDVIHEWFELRYDVASLPAETADAIVRAYCRGAVSKAAPVVLPSGATVMLQRDDLETLLDPVLESIATFVAQTIRELPNGVATEVIESGVHLTGGGAHLTRLVREIETRVGMPLVRTEDPLHAVIRGAGAMLRNRQLLTANA